MSLIIASIFIPGFNFCLHNYFHMDNQLNQSESVIVFSHGDHEDESQPQLSTENPKTDLLPKTDEPSISFSKSHFLEGRKFLCPEVIEERNPKSEQDGSVQDSFAGKSENDEKLYQVKSNKEEECSEGKGKEEILGRKDDKIGDRGKTDEGSSIINSDSEKILTTR